MLKYLHFVIFYPDISSIYLVLPVFMHKQLIAKKQTSKLEVDQLSNSAA